MLETLDYTIRIGSTPTILYFDLYLLYVCYSYKMRVWIIRKLNNEWASFIDQKTDQKTHDC